MEEYEVDKIEVNSDEEIEEHKVDEEELNKKAEVNSDEEMEEYELDEEDMMEEEIGKKEVNSDEEMEEYEVDEEEMAEQMVKEEEEKKEENMKNGKSNIEEVNNSSKGTSNDEIMNYNTNKSKTMIYDNIIDLNSNSYNSKTEDSGKGNKDGNDSTNSELLEYNISAEKDSDMHVKNKNSFELFDEGKSYVTADNDKNSHYNNFKNNFFF
ncbi:hypothetical protein PMALA_046410 [Plasmodium malariae]|nr:hypothetical protein PMALA_046410 [Plasmodium malariae]